MLTYVALIKLTPEGMENLAKAPEYLKKIKTIIEEEQGGVSRRPTRSWAPGLLCAVQYPDTETAFRVLAKIGLLEVSTPRPSRLRRSTSS